jgi:hypothetical protein
MEADLTEKIDCWDVSRVLKPELTWEEFEEFWAGYLRDKAAHLQHLALH